MREGNRIRESLEHLWYGGEEPRGLPVRLLSCLLRGAGRAYRVAAALRWAPYRLGFLRPLEIAVPVVSVGNLTVGGSGKSPTCLEVARMGAERGCRPAVVSHSYGAPGRRRKPLVFSGQEAVPSWRLVGDEAAMMGLAQPGLLVAAGSDKAGSAVAAAKAGAGLVIIDDAFHRLDIRRDLDIVVFDGRRGLGNHLCLPAGPLREPETALARADAFLVVDPPPGEGEGLAEHLALLHPGAPILLAERVVTGLRNLRGGGQAGNFPIVGTRVWAFCGLGNPAGFVESLTSTGASLAGTSFFADHHPYTSGDLDAVCRAAVDAGASAVVTTAKDAVKVEEWPQGAPTLLVLDTGLRLVRGREWLEGRLDELVGARAR